MSQAHDTPDALLRDAAQFFWSQREHFGANGVEAAEGVFKQRAAAAQAATVAVQDATRQGISAAATPATTAPNLGAEGLADISADIGDCTRCKLCRGRTNIVFGVGAPKARLMFVGEGPGRDEDLQGEPFVGEAGKLLTRMIGAMGLTRSDVYIANIVKCRPPRNRDPEPDEVASCEPFLLRQIAAIRPEVLVGLGRYAVQTLLRDPTPISRLRGRWRSYDGIALMPTFHPAYLLRNPAGKRHVWEDLQDVMKKLGLPPAAAGKKDGP